MDPFKGLRVLETRKAQLEYEKELIRWLYKKGMGLGSIVRLDCRPTHWSKGWVREQLGVFAK